MVAIKHAEFVDCGELEVVKRRDLPAHACTSPAGKPAPAKLPMSEVMAGARPPGESWRRTGPRGRTPDRQVAFKSTTQRRVLRATDLVGGGFDALGHVLKDR